MPLAQKVTFKRALQRGNRVQIPKLIRWQFKMETNEVSRVGDVQHCYAKISKAASRLRWTPTMLF
jgi:UDP-glucose 4-epimerase